MSTDSSIDTMRVEVFLTMLIVRKFGLLDVGIDLSQVVAHLVRYDRIALEGGAECFRSSRIGLLINYISRRASHSVAVVPVTNLSRPEVDIPISPEKHMLFRSNYGMWRSASVDLASQEFLS